MIFDLDGVLVDSKEIHFNALNYALAEIGPELVISREEQNTTYEGLTTRKKLEILTATKGLDPNKVEKIWQSKQEHSAGLFANLKKDEDLVELFSYIRSRGVSIGVVSNSIKNTLIFCLRGLGLLDLVDVYISNEDVFCPKPDPEGYLLAMNLLGVFPENAAIFEDSDVGKIAAVKSGATLIPVFSRMDITQNLISSVIAKL